MTEHYFRNSRKIKVVVVWQLAKYNVIWFFVLRALFIRFLFRHENLLNSVLKNQRKKAKRF
jgi:hypothetical protein